MRRGGGKDRRRDESNNFGLEVGHELSTSCSFASQMECQALALSKDHSEHVEGIHFNGVEKNQLHGDGLA